MTRRAYSFDSSAAWLYHLNILDHYIFYYYCKPFELVRLGLSDVECVVANNYFASFHVLPTSSFRALALVFQGWA
jgi:hypothetical protein